MLQADHELPEDAGPDDRLAELPEPLREYARRTVADVLGRPSLPDEKLTKDLGDSLLHLRARNLRTQIRQVESLIQESETAGTPDGRDEARRRALNDLLLGPG